MAETTVPMDDKALMEGAFAAEPTEKPVETPQENEKLRDELGRFAPKTEQEPEPVVVQEQPVQPQKTEEDDKSGHVPSWRLREEREAREAATKRADDAARESFAFRQQMQDMQRRLEQLQKPKQEPVDFFQNPDEAFQQRMTPLQERQAEFESKLQFRMSRTMAIAEHGAAAVKEMEEAVRKANREGHPEIRMLSVQMDNSDDPVSVAMNWHKRSKLLEETGGDLTTYRQKALDDALNDPEFLAKALERARAQAGQPARSSINLPPSLSRAAGTGATEKVGLTAEDMTDASLYAHATARGGR